MFGDGDLSLADGEREIDNYLQILFNYLDTGIMKQNPRQYMKTYTCIVKLSDECDKSAELYQIFQQRIDHYIQNRVQKALQNKMGQSQEFLKEYCEQWKKFAIFTFCMKKIFEYLDRYHLKNAGALSLTDTALEYFRKSIFTSRITQVRRCILDEIEKDR